VIRVLAVDDHPLLRDGIAALIGSEEDIELIGEASNGREAVDLPSERLEIWDGHWSQQPVRLSKCTACD
jgi:DNA-binding NarL/FixJ family response regulator